MEKILAQNLAAFMKARPDEFGTQEKVAKATRGSINQTTVGRILAEKHRVTLRTLVCLAHGLGIEPYQLLIWNLDPKNPQILRKLSEAEDNLYRALEAARKPAGTQ